MKRGIFRQGRIVSQTYPVFLQQVIADEMCIRDSMGTILRLVNRVAEAVKEAYPENDISIVTLAYLYSRKPTAVTVPGDNVIIFLCTCDCCFNHAYNDSSCEVNKGFSQDIEGWSKICERIYIWDYHMDFTFSLSAFPYFDQMLKNVRYFAQNNVIGYYAQGYRSGAVTGRFGELSAYLASKLAWDPNMTDAEYNEIIDEFLRLYYCLLYTSDVYKRQRLKRAVPMPAR